MLKLSAKIRQFFDIRKDFREKNVFFVRKVPQRGQIVSKNI